MTDNLGETAFAYTLPELHHMIALGHFPTWLAMSSTSGAPLRADIACAVTYVL
jgi:hypothetical protein